MSSDKAFIASSFIKSLRCLITVDGDTYKAFAENAIADYMDRYQVLMAEYEGNPIGYIIFDHSRRFDTIIFAYVKKVFRQLGVCHKLVDSACTSRHIYSLFQPKHSNVRVKYNPFIWRFLK